MWSRKYVVPKICRPEKCRPEKKKFGGTAPEPPREGLRPLAPPSNPPARPAQVLKHYYLCKEYNTYPTVSELVFGFRGMPLLQRVWLGLDRSSLSWVCDKPRFSGRFCSGDLSKERGMTSSSRIKIEKFNGKNFELWKLKMEDLLVDKEQWIAVDPGTQPTGTPYTSTQAIGTQPTSTQTTSTPAT
jgi:hypothetical protein